MTTMTTDNRGLGERRFTPGPWRLFLTTDGRKLIGIGEATGDGVTDCGFGTWRDGEEQLANARLIAAAPEMLEALLLCQRSAAFAHSVADGLRVVEAINAAISKALNQEPSQ